MTARTDPPTAEAGAAPTASAPPVEPAPAPPPAPPPAEPRQRWRVTFARDPVPADQVGRVALDAWQDALVASGLPLAGLDGGPTGRARIAFAAPLPAGARGDAELADVWLLERRPLWDVREALAPRLPAAHRWVGAEDIWIGAPPLAGRVVAADWLIEVAGVGLDRASLDIAAASLLAARALPRIRRKGTAEKPYDMRPLLADIAIEAAGARPAGRSADVLVVRLRTRFHPELGAGRPEEVIDAMAGTCGVAIEIGNMARTRLALSDDLPARGRRPLSSGATGPRR